MRGEGFKATEDSPGILTLAVSGKNPVRREVVITSSSNFRPIAQGSNGAINRREAAENDFANIQNEPPRGPSLKMQKSARISELTLSRNRKHKNLNLLLATNC